MLNNKVARILFCAFLGTLLGTLFSACSGSLNDRASVDALTEDQSIPLGQLPEGVTPTGYSLLITADPAADSFSGVVKIKLSLNEPHQRIWLHSRDHDIQHVLVRFGDDQMLSASSEQIPHSDGVLKLDFEDEIPAGAAELEIVYSADYNLGLAGLYKATQNNEPYLASQMEPIDARRFVPSFDEPRFKTPWTLSVRAPAGLQVVANGPLVSQIELENSWIEHRFATTRTIPTYLLALAIGPYDKRDEGVLPSNSVRSFELPYRGFAPDAKGEQLTEMLNTTEAMLAWQEAYFDYPYPYAKLDLIAAPDFAYGAMENVGAIVYREDRLLLDERTSLSDRRRALVTHAHELGHQWFGNLVTPLWWNDIWLNEAFATWVSYKTLDAAYPGTGFDLEAQMGAISVMDADSLFHARQIRNPILRNADIFDAFDGITYRKGGGVLAMFETYLGDDVFREGVRLHMRRHQDDVADVNDFMQSLADASGDTDVIESFRSFIFQPGIPYLDARLSCSADNRGQLSITQTRYAPIGSEIDTDKSQWVIPFAARVGYSDNSYEIRQMLTDKTTNIELEQGCADWVMPNSNGAGYWRFHLEQTDWEQLLAHFQALNDGEQLALADSLTAAFAAGNLSVTHLHRGLSLSSQGFWGATADILGQIPAYFYAVPEGGQREGIRQFVTETLGTRYEQLNSQPENELSVGESLLKSRLYARLVEYGHFEAERDRLADAAVRYIGHLGEPDSAALDPEQVEIALAVAAQRADESYYVSAVQYALGNQNQGERRLVLDTLARHLPQPLVLDLLSRVLEDQFQGQEAWDVSLSALENKEAQAEAWDAFQVNFERIIERTPEIRKTHTTEAVAAFCDPDSIAEAVAFFHANAASIPGYERRLAQSEETARLCSAFRAEKGQTLAESFSY